jgi:hypothetical protein
VTAAAFREFNFDEVIPRSSAHVVWKNVILGIFLIELNKFVCPSSGLGCLA